MKQLIVILASLALAIAASAQQPTPCPLTVVKFTTARTYWSDGSPKESTVEVQNVSDKEIAVAQYVFTYSDKLDRVTDVIAGEPVTVHESGHRTLRPGKKGTQWFQSSILHPNDHVSVSVVTVKFADGTLWEAPKK